MRHSWQQGKSRPIGLQKQRLPYGHLHMPVQTDEDAETAIRAPPKSDSSRASSSRHSSPPSRSDSPPPIKRRKLEPPSSQHVNLTSPSLVKKDHGNDDVTSSQPSNIQPTLFTSSDPSNYPRKRGRSIPFSGQGLRYDHSNDPEDEFAAYHSSQSKVKNSYSSRQSGGNIHKSAPARKAQTRPKKEPKHPEQLVRTGTKGFKTFDTKAMHSLSMQPVYQETADADMLQVKTPEKKRSAKAFNALSVLSSSPRSKRAARRSGNAVENHEKPARDKTFKKPPKPPSPQLKKSTSPPFVVPKVLSQSTQNIPSIDPSNLETMKTKLNIPIDAPTSSAALSSGPSFEFDVDDGDSSSSLSSAPEIEELHSAQFHQKWLEDHPPASPKTKCPLCEDLVSQLFMQEFAASAVLSVRQQQEFHRAHRVRSAEESWRGKGYPVIDWDLFSQRLSQYDAALSSILNGTSSSFYRNAFEDQVNHGVNRTLQQALMSGSDWEGLKRGYYGTKGARIM